MSSIREDLATINANLKADWMLLNAMSRNMGNNIINNDIFIPESCYVAENWQNGNYARIVIKEKKLLTQTTVLRLRNELNRMILNGDADLQIQFKML